MLGQTLKMIALQTVLMSFDEDFLFSLLKFQKWCLRATILWNHCHSTYSLFFQLISFPRFKIAVFGLMDMILYDISKYKNSNSIPRCITCSFLFTAYLWLFSETIIKNRQNSAKNFGCDNLPSSDHRKNLKNDPIDLIFLCWVTFSI